MVIIHLPVYAKMQYLLHPGVCSYRGDVNGVAVTETPDDELAQVQDFIAALTENGFSGQQIAVALYGLGDEDT
jgi:hypothetical protein